MSDIERKADGTFVGSGNPKGRPPEERRKFVMDQTTKDLLELLDQPVMVTKGGKKKKVPAIVAIYDKMVHLAVAGDWQAIKKCVELREKYTASRTDTLGTMLERVTAIRQHYQARDETMPDHIWGLVDDVEKLVAEGQFRAG